MWSRFRSAHEATRSGYQRSMVSTAMRNRGSISLVSMPMEVYRVGVWDSRFRQSFQVFFHALPTLGLQQSHPPPPSPHPLLYSSSSPVESPRSLPGSLPVGWGTVLLTPIVCGHGTY